jgi:hypothetical protein
MNVLQSHPYLTIYFHNPKDPYTSYQRLCVVFTTLFSFMASNAMFFGMGKRSIEDDLNIAIYSSFIVAPVGAIFPILFTKAAFMIRGAEEEEKFLKSLHLEVVERVVSNAGYRLMYFAFGFLYLWSAGAIFLCLSM